MDSDEMTLMLTFLRQSLRTSYSNMPVQFIVNLSQEYTNTTLPSLCQMDMMEFIEQSKKLTDLLTNTLQSTGISSQAMVNTSTSHTFVPTQMSLVDALGYSDQQHGQRTENVNFAELLGQPNSSQSITPTYCDTYLKPLDSSTELVASQKMSDYLIDINIYRLVLKQYLLKQRYQQLNKHNYYINYIRPLTKPKFTTQPLKYSSTAFLYNTPMLYNIQKVLNIDYSSAFKVLLVLCSSHLEFLEIFDYHDMITSTEFNEYNHYESRCCKCTFVHAPITTDTEHEIRKQIKNTYKLLNTEEIEYIIIRMCKINTYINVIGKEI